MPNKYSKFNINILKILLFFIIFVFACSTISFSNYNIYNLDIYKKDNIRYLKKISPGTTVSTLKAYIKTDSNEQINVFNTKNVLLSDNDFLTTGAKLKINNDEYILVVLGDVNGSGTITISDFSVIRQLLIKKIRRTGAYFEAGDINCNGKLGISDVARIKSVIIGKSHLTNPEIPKTENISVESIKITSPESGAYSSEQLITVEANFSNKIRGIAPNMSLHFDKSNTTVVAKPQEIKDGANTIIYTYTATKLDFGEVSIANFEGGNLKGYNFENIVISKKENSGNKIVIEETHILEIHFLNLGRVDGILFRCDGENMFMDSGFESDGKDTVKYLKQLGITDLKYLISSHPHKNHIEGFIPISNYANITESYFSEYARSGYNVFTSIASHLKSKKIPVKRLKVGNTLSLGGSTINCLGPLRKIPSSKYSDNDESLVFTLELGEQKFLFTGDISSSIQKELYNKYSGTDNLDSVLLKSPHHGGGINSNFLKAVSPQYLVVCSNKATTPSAVSGKDIKVYHTSKGTVVMTTDGKNINIKQ